jgi:hypothetical protein
VPFPARLADLSAAFMPGIEALEVQDVEREFNADFLRNMLDRLDWDAFVAAAATVRVSRLLFCITYVC